MNKGAIWITFGVFALLAWVIAGSVLALYLYERNVSTGYSVRFGIVSVLPDESAMFVKEASVLPLRYKDSGFCYGIQITPPDDKPYTYHCVFHFSSLPKVVSGEYFEGKEPSTTLQTNEISVEGGTMVDENWFDPGDPVGDQSMDVFINGKFVTTFKYKVVPKIDSQEKLKRISFRDCLKSDLP